MIVLLAIAPLLKSSLFWAYLIQLKEYRYDRFRDYLNTPDAIRAIFSVQHILELVWIIIYLLWSREVIWYILALETLFVLYKLLNKGILKPVFTSKMIMIYSLDLLIQWMLIFALRDNPIYILLILLCTFWFIAISTILTLPISFYLKKRIISQAKHKIESLSNLTSIWVTWSFGKTTVKEFLYQIISSYYPTICTPENQNTPLGVSNAIIKLISPETRYFICEMWAYRIGEIKELGDIVKHKIGFLTWIWDQHLGLFGSIEAIIQTKFEIIVGASHIYVNNDNVHVNKNVKEGMIRYWIQNKSSDCKLLSYNYDERTTYFVISYRGKVYSYVTPIYWEHNLLNLTWVIACCIDLGLSESQISDSVKKLEMPESTFKAIQRDNDVIYIDDTHNLSEDWLLASINALTRFKWYKKILVLDDVIELWPDSPKIHFRLWQIIAKEKLDLIKYVGSYYKKDFIAWLVDWWYSIEQIVEKLCDISHKTVILFEWRASNKTFKGLIS